MTRLPHYNAGIGQALEIGLETGLIEPVHFYQLVAKYQNDGLRKSVERALDAAPQHAGPEVSTGVGLASVVAGVSKSMLQDLADPDKPDSHGSELDVRVMGGDDVNEKEKKKKKKPKKKRPWWPECNELGDPQETRPPRPLSSAKKSSILAWIQGLEYMTGYIAPEVGHGRGGGVTAGAPAPPTVDPDFREDVPGLENPRQELLWRSDRAKADFPYVRPEGPGGERFLQFRVGTMIYDIKYFGNGWMHGRIKSKQRPDPVGYFPENHVSPRFIDFIPEPYGSAEDGVEGLDDDGKQTVTTKEWELRDLARKHLSGLHGSVVDPSKDLRKALKELPRRPKVPTDTDPEEHAPYWITTYSKRKTVLDLFLQKKEGQEPGEYLKRIQSWEERTKLVEIEDIIDSYRGSDTEAPQHPGKPDKGKGKEPALPKEPEQPEQPEHPEQPEQPEEPEQPGDPKKDKEKEKEKKKKEKEEKKKQKEEEKKKEKEDKKKEKEEKKKEKEEKKKQEKEKKKQEKEDKKKEKEDKKKKEKEEKEKKKKDKDKDKKRCKYLDPRCWGKNRGQDSTTQ